MAEQQTNGRRRRRTPKKSVLIADRIARWTIALGGIGSIVAVSLVGLFLFYVVVPLFLPPSLEEEANVAVGASKHVVHLGLDEYGTMAWALHRDGSIVVRSLSDGEVVKRLEVPGAPLLTCWSFGIDSDQCAFGYADGTVRLGAVGFATEFLDADELPADLHELAAGETATFGSGTVQLTPENQFRHLEMTLTVDEPLQLATHPIALVDQSVGNTGPLLAALDRADVLHVRRLRRRRNLLTGETTTRIRGESLDLREAGLMAAGETAPAHLLLTGLGDNVMLAWTGGRLLRIDTSNPSDPQPTGELDLVPENGHQLTAITFQIGKASLVTGDDLGRIRVWFRVKDPGGQHRDGTSLVLAHELSGVESVATSLTASARTRLIAAGFTDGTAALYHLTSGRRLATVAVANEPVNTLALGPRDDVMLTLVDGGAKVWHATTWLFDGSTWSSRRYSACQSRDRDSAPTVSVRTGSFAARTRGGSSSSADSVPADFGWS